jgi:hypothetical protein
LGGSGCGFGRGRSGEGRGAHRGSICSRRRGGKAPGGGSRRWPTVPSAGAPAPVEGRRRRWRPRHGEVVWGRVELLGCLAGGGRVELSKLVVGHRGRTAASSCAWAAGCAGLNSRPAPCLHDEGTRRLNSPVRRRPRQGRSARSRVTDRWTVHGGHTARHVRLDDSSRFEVAGAKGTNDSRLEAVGSEPARTPRRRSVQRAAQGRQADCRRSGGALERGRAVFQPVNTTLTACFSKKLNYATKTVDTKVVDETSLYNICKGCPMFFSTV